MASKKIPTPEVFLKKGSLLCANSACPAKLEFEVLGTMRIKRQHEDGRWYYEARCSSVSCGQHFKVTAPADPKEKGRGQMPHQYKVGNMLRDGPDKAIIAVQAGGGKRLIGTLETEVVMSDELKISNLAYLVKRLVYQLKKSQPDSPLAVQAITFIDEHVGPSKVLRTTGVKK